MQLEWSKCQMNNLRHFETDFKSIFKKKNRYPLPASLQQIDGQRKALVGGCNNVGRSMAKDELNWSDAFQLYLI